MRKRFLSALCVVCLTALILCAPYTSAYAEACDCAGGIHNYDTVIVDATETEAGSITYTCQICGYTYTEIIPPYGHDWGPWITDAEPTCVAPGHQHRVCMNNSDHRQERTIPASGAHQYEKTYVAPTCTEAGKTVFTCKYCGDSYEEPDGSALGHDYQVTDARDAACGEAGLTVYTCSRCGDTYTETVPALPAPASSSTGKPNALDYVFCVAEALLAISLSLGLMSQRRIIKWDKELERKFKSGHQ